MPRKALALLLLFSWFLLVGFDLVDLGPSHQAKHYTFSETAESTDDSAESAEAACAYGIGFFDQSTAGLFPCDPQCRQRRFKLHKLYHNYRI
jgi:hypothetical protein